MWQSTGSQFWNGSRSTLSHEVRTIALSAPITHEYYKGQRTLQAMLLTTCKMASVFTTYVSIETNIRFLFQYLAIFANKLNCNYAIALSIV